MGTSVKGTNRGQSLYCMGTSVKEQTGGRVCIVWERV